MQNHKFGVTCSITLFLESVSVPPEHEKQRLHFSCPRHTGMHYITHITHQVQKHNFNIMFPDALFMETALGPREHEKLCVDISSPRCTKMDYVTHISNRMQKTQVWHNVSWYAFSAICTTPT
jgi:hypothetical protein